MTKYHLFIAHSAKDEKQAIKLYNFLSERYDIFLDIKSLSPGDLWDRLIPEAQKESLITVILISSKTENSYYHREEIAAAIELSRNESNRHRVVPIFLDKVNLDAPYGLLRIHGIHLERYKSLKKVAVELEKLLSKVDDKAKLIQKKKTKVEHFHSKTHDDLIILLKQIVEINIKNNKSICIIFFDLDNFSGINSKFGHNIADEVISHISKLTLHICGKNYCERWNGDEFIVCLEDTRENDALKVAKELQEAIVEYRWGVIVPGLYVGGSFGVAEYINGEEVSEWVLRSIVASKNAKKPSSEKVRVAPMSIPPIYSRNYADWDS